MPSCKKSMKKTESISSKNLCAVGIPEGDARIHSLGQLNRTMKQKIIYFVVLLLAQMLFQGRVWASHIFGGDIVYECVGNNKFRFTFTLFQDCLTGQQDAIAQDVPSHYAIYEIGTNTLVTYGSTGMYIEQNIVPTGFSNDCINNIPNTCMQRTVFQFEVSLPPNNNGYVFVYQRCCRNQFINNIFSPGVTGATFTSYIPPFTSGQCPNNSAKFKNNPPQIICVNDPLSFDFSATDIDGDSLSYELCNAFIGGTQWDPIPTASGIMPPPHTPVAYISPYDSAYPIPSNPAFTIDPITGMLTGKPTQIGRYVFTVCVREWRNGNVINTLRRDLQFVITDCSKAVIADMPSFSHEPDVYIARCDSIFTVHFQNTSQGGFAYFWDFGDPNTLADTSRGFAPSYTYPDTGTYYVKLIVNPGSTCSDSIVKKVKIYPKFKAEFDIEGKFCKGEEIKFIDKTQSTFPEIYGWQWDMGDGSSYNQQDVNHVFDARYENFDVSLIVKNTKGCIDTASARIRIPRFEPFAGNDTLVVKDATFNMNGSGGLHYQWSPTDYIEEPNNPKSAITIPEVGYYRYRLDMTSAEGCVGYDSVRIRVVPHPYFVVPNAFSPNGDGRNDVIRPIVAGYANIVFFRIYNRWGQLVFDMNSDRAGGWDGTFNGKMADPGVYFWHGKARNPEGEVENFYGEITLIR